MPEILVGVFLAFQNLTLIAAQLYIASEEVLGKKKFHATL